MTSHNPQWDFDELLRLGREAGQSLHAEDGRDRMQQAAALLKTVGTAKSAVASNPLLSLQIIAQEAGKMHQTAEVERTRREAIEAQRQVVLARIEATRLLLDEYMTRTFDERKGTLNRMFDALDSAQASGDTSGMQHLLGSIVDIVKASPFKDLASFRRNYDDPEFVLEI